MINNREDFSRVYSDLLSKHNYRGLVGLLSSTTFNDEASRDTATKLIEKFQEQADIENKLLEGADDRTIKAYNFITSGPSANEISTDESNSLYNSPSSRFMRSWNALADENNRINIKFNSEIEYNKFITSLGGNEKNIRNKGIDLDSNYSVSFGSDIQDKIAIFNAIKDSGIVANMRARLNAAREAESDAYYTPGSDVYSANRKKRKASSDYFGNFATQFRNMEEVVREANNSYAALLENVKPYINEMIVTGYMGEDDRQLQQSFSAGLLDLQSFKAMREILEEKYNRVLQTKSLSQYDVWAMNEDNEGSQVLEPLEDNLAKSEIDVEINQAIADGRLHYSHATNGLDIGTMLVIDPKVDKDGKVIGDSKPIRLFVKDLFRSQAENALRDDTQITAQRQYAKHQTYGHIYRSVDGRTIDGWNQATDSAIYTDKNGVTQNVDKAQILDILDNDAVAKRMIEYYDLATKVDPNGNGYTEEYFKVFGNGGWSATNFYNNIAAKCMAAMASKYKGQSEEFIKYKANELISTILKSVHNVHKQESKDIFSELYMKDSGNILY